MTYNTLLTNFNMVDFFRKSKFLGYFYTIKKDEINVMETALEILKDLNLIPRKRNDKFFKLKFALMFPLLGVIVFGCATHVIVNLKNNLPLTDYIEDFYFIMTTLSVFYFFPVFMFKRPQILKLFDYLSDFERFGMPENAKKVNKQVNIMIILFQVYVNFGAGMFTLLGLLTNESCMTKRTVNHSQVVCGMMTTFYMPFEIDYFPMKQFMIVLEWWSARTMGKSQLFMLYVGPACIEHIVMRIDHLMKLLKDIFEDVDDRISRQKLNKCIKYHNHIIELVNLMNRCFSSIVFFVLLTSAVIISLLLYGSFLDYSFKTILSLLIFLAGIYIMCYGGQRLLNKSHELSQVLFQIPWYTMDVSMQKKVLMMMRRSQKDMTFKALNVGIMCHKTFQEIIRTSYSVLTLLKSTKDH